MSKAARLLKKLKETSVFSRHSLETVNELEREINDLPKKVLRKAAGDLQDMRHGSYRQAARLLYERSMKIKEQDYD